MKAVKLTSKNQASVPKEVRDFLSVGPGESIVYSIEDDKVVVSKFKEVDREWLESIGDTLEEWNSESDEEAFEHLQDI